MLCPLLLCLIHCRVLRANSCNFGSYNFASPREPSRTGHSNRFPPPLARVFLFPLALSLSLASHIAALSVGSRKKCVY
uniref:Secreted protein n=1 Tax=Ixodes ricinus TaxID=34613 RepID=A0A6B0U0I8_IXORI